MKRFSQFILEAKETKASSTAKRLGLTGNGHGDWYNAQGEFVAKTVKGELKFFTKGQRIGKRDIPPTPKTKQDQDQVAATQVKQPEYQQQSQPKIDTRDEPQEVGDETVTIVFGRFNPPTKGHKQLFSAAKRLSGGGEIRIYPSRVQDPNKNPLEPSKKIGFLRKMYPEFSDNIIDNDYMVTIFDVLQVANEDGFGNANIVVSADRQSEIQNLANKYNNDIYKFNEIRVVSAGTSDAEKDASGVSSAKARKAAIEGKFDQFKMGMPSDFEKSEVKKLYNSLRSAMGAKKQQVESYELWKVAPNLDYKNLRENYVSNKVFKLDENVMNLNTGLTGKVIRRGTNYLICVTEDNMMFKSWIKDVIETKDIEIPSNNLKKLVRKASKRVDDNIDGFVDKNDKKVGPYGAFIPQTKNLPKNFKEAYQEKKVKRKMRVPGKPNTLVGTDGYFKYVADMTPGFEKGDKTNLQYGAKPYSGYKQSSSKEFINKYKVK